MSESAWVPLLPRLERDLIARRTVDASLRDDDAWTDAHALILAASHFLYASPLHLDSPEVEDVAQDVLLKLQQLRVLHLVRSSRSPDGYIRVILRNAGNDVLRRRRRKMEAPLADEFYASAFHEESFPSSVTNRQLRWALTQIRQEDYQLLRMRFWEDLSISEIANRSRMRYSACATRISRVLQRLRYLMGTSE